MGKKSKEKTTKSIGKVMRNKEKTNETKAKERREKKEHRQRNLRHNFRKFVIFHS